MQDNEPHANATSKDYDLRLFAQMLKPSTLSALVCLLLSFFVVAGVVAMTRYQGSSFQRDVLGFQERKEKDRQTEFAGENFEDFSVSEDYNQINDTFADSNLVRNIPVMAFWMFVGTLVYFLVTGIAGAIGGARDLGDELHFVHARRKELLAEVYTKSAIRFGALLIWLGYITLFFRIILPYVLAAAHVSADLSFKFAPYLLLSFLVLALGLHIHAIMVRLVALRPRLFAQETSF